MDLRGVDSPGIASTDPALWDALVKDWLDPMPIEKPASSVSKESTSDAHADSTSRR